MFNPVRILSPLAKNLISNGLREIGALRQERNRFGEVFFASMNGNATDIYNNSASPVNVSFPFTSNGYGSQMANFSGNGQIEYSSPITALGTDWTLSFDICSLNGAGTLRIIFSEYTTTQVVTIGIHTNNQLFVFYGSTANYSGVTATTGHYDISRKGTLTTVYKDGAKLFSFTQGYSSGTFSAKKYVGAQFYSGSPQDRFNGSLQNFSCKRRESTLSESLELARNFLKLIH